MSSSPLVVADVSRWGDTGKNVMVSCREPSPCLSGTLQGFSVVVNAAIDRIEAIHQSAHALRDTQTDTGGK